MSLLSVEAAYVALSQGTQEVLRILKLSTDLNFDNLNFDSLRESQQQIFSIKNFERQPIDN